MKNNPSFYKKRIKKKLGQNFLCNKEIIRKMISFIKPDLNSEIIEIGPGHGEMTKEFLYRYHNYYRRILVIEIDKNLIFYLSHHSFLREKIKILEENVIQVNFQKLSEKLKKPLQIFGNIPYSISTPLILHLFKHINVISSMHLTFQKEFAERLLAIPNNKCYGRLSILTQYFCKVRKMLEIPREFFFPTPKVHSVMIEMTPNKKNLEKNKLNCYHIKNLEKITRLAFKQRRKIIKNSLKDVFSEKKLERIGINIFLRAENINLEQYCILSKEL